MLKHLTAFKNYKCDQEEKKKEKRQTVTKSE